MDSLMLRTESKFNTYIALIRDVQHVLTGEKEDFHFSGKVKKLF